MLRSIDRVIAALKRRESSRSNVCIVQHVARDDVDIGGRLAPSRCRGEFMVTLYISLHTCNARGDAF